MPYLMGIDVGTQGLRACLFDLDGNMAAEASTGYPTQRPKASWVEQDPRAWLNALIASVREVFRKSSIPARDVIALSYACTSCTVVALDERGLPLRPALLWMDERARHEADRVTATRHPVLRFAGGREGKESPQWMIPKAMWISDHEPEIFARTRWIVEQTDFFTFHLTGRWTVSRSNAAAKWHYVQERGGLPYDLLEELGYGHLAEKWPREVVPVGTKLGTLSREFASASGLFPGTLVVQGGVDAHAAQVGVGALTPGAMALVIGTSTCHMAQSRSPVFADVWGPYDGPLAEGTFTLGGGQSTSGSVMQWLLENIFGGKFSYQELDALASQVPPGSEGLIALDFFQGNRTPFKDPLARGGLWGLTLRHGPAHLWRAFYEAVAFGTRAILENLDRHGYHVEKLLAAGGGSKSRLWMKIHADVSGRPVQLTLNEEPAALGAAIWAGIGAGIFKGYDEAIARVVHRGDVLSPDGALKEVYDFSYHKYVETYERLKSLMAEMAEFEERREMGKDGNSKEIECK